MNMIATTPVTGKTLPGFFRRISTVQEADWQSDWGHPYAFKWSDEVFREQVVHWLVGSDKRQTDYAGKDLLRWLLYRFRAAQFRRTAPMGTGFTGHRWIWATHAEVSRATGLSEHQIRRAVDRLEGRGLVRQVSDYALNHVPHYRPSTDLFRACRILTMLTDDDCIDALHPQADDDYAKDLQKTHALLRAEFHDNLRAMVQGFAASKAENRAAVLLNDFLEHMQRAFALVEERA